MTTQTKSKKQASKSWKGTCNYAQCPEPTKIQMLYSSTVLGKAVCKVCLIQGAKKAGWI